MNIAIPFVGMMLLTLVVWVFMYVKRMGYVGSNKLDPNSMPTPEKVNAMLP